MAAPLVLASGSPRRRRLLTAAGLAFEVVPAAVEELATAVLTARELTIGNATRKALAVARTRRDAVVLGADTLVALAGAVIGKPHDRADAVRILRRLSGREHEVCTAVCICALGGQRRRSFCVTSSVRFRPLSGEQITDYIAKVNPLDKAGAYAAQGHGAEIIEQIRGSYTNVVGLPMEETLRALREFGIRPALPPERETPARRR